MRRRPSALTIASILVVLMFTLVVAAGFQFDAVQAPSAEAWVEASEEIGATNVVSAIYLGVRLFDTLLEVFVFAVAVLGVRHYLGDRPASPEASASLPESHIVQASARVFLPLIVLIGINVTVYGHIAPGGGFSGGAIAASALLLVALALGGDGIAERFNDSLFERIEWIVLLLLLGLTLLPVVTGRVPLCDILPAGVLGHLNSAGTFLPHNLLIGLKVFIASWVIIHHFLMHRGEI